LSAEVEMPPRPSHYEFFGVPPTASAEQIRTAYLALMKQCHPDRVQADERQEQTDFAAVVNRYYDVLKDPGSRARYDAILAFRESEGPRPRGNRRALLAGTTARKHRKGWDRSSVAAAILACAIGVVSIAALTLPSGFLAPASGNAVATAATANASERLSVGTVQREVRLAMSVAPAAAVQESESCFDGARRQSSEALLQGCIVFDDAYLDWSQLADDDRGQSLYFNEALVRLRQRNAAAALGRADDASLDELRSIALDALLAEIRSRLDTRAMAPAADPKPVTAQ
jgi:hypothetical protein